MKHLLSLLLITALAGTAFAQAPWANGPLQVSANGRFLQHTNGKPFFWLADTCWLAVQKFSREEAKSYFENRRAKGFNVVQCTAVQMLTDKTVYGDVPFAGGDVARLLTTTGSDPADAEQYDYWDHLDYLFETAAANGIYLALAPTWSHTVRRAPIPADKAARYVAALAQRLKDRPNLIWLNGGAAKGDVDADVWQAIGVAIKEHDPRHLMTFHAFGRTQSSTWFRDATWLDFHTFTSGHRRYDQDTDGKQFGEDNWRYVLDDLAKSPRKPTLDTEPSYEDTPQGLHDANQPYWNADDVRRYAYWSVFAGACGHTYGQNSVRQVYKPSDPRPSSGAKHFYTTVLDAPGAGQMRHVKNLMLSRPYFDRVSFQAVAVGDEGEKYDRVLVTKGKEFLMAYTSTGRDFKLALGETSGAEVVAWWFNPRTGEAAKAGTHKNTGTVAFNPPGEPGRGNDWVLVLDDASKALSPPGAGAAR